MEDERLGELIHKFHQKCLNSDEKVEFETLLRDSEEACKLFHDYNFVNQLTQTLALNKNIPEIEIQEFAPKIDWAKVRRFVINTAAVFTIPLLVMLFFTKVNSTNETVVSYSEVTCTNAKVVTVMLPDGSNVHLYSGSKLRYPNQFTEKGRSVTLFGEATFEVVSDKERPFYVETGNNIRVKAYGTKFSVKDYKEENTVTVYLERGKVDFESESLSQPIVMIPNTQILYNKESKNYTLREAVPQEYDAYEKGILMFNNRALSEIVRKLERIHGVDIEIRGEELKNTCFTATFDNESIYQILNMLNLSSPRLNWSKEENKIILTQNNNLKTY